MSKLSTSAGLLGMATGIWALALSFLDGAIHSCPAGGCPAQGVSLSGILVVALGVALAFNSAVSFFWHKGVLYMTSLLSVLLATAVVLNSGAYDRSGLWVCVAIAAVSAAVNLVAARAGTGMAEQANPMNLPVFG